MHKLLTAGAALLALGLSVPAKAADMPVKYVAPAPIFTWTGCYVGGTVGYKWGRSKHEATGIYNGKFFPGFAGDTAQFNLDGVIGGGEAGCNYQVGNWVYGIEADGSWSTAEGQAQDAIPNPPFLFVSKTSERWLATARGRLGYAFDKWLWYVTAGAAWTGVDINSSNVGNGAPTIWGIERVNKIGWVAGFGSEYALVGGWSVKSEWLYANFGKIHALDVSCNSAVVPVCGTPGFGVTSRDVSLNEFIWRVGMNYRFDWGSYR
jgi:outer membrane immunogenic protein